MAIFEDLQWLEDELLEDEAEDEYEEEEPQEEAVPQSRMRRRKRMHQAVYADEIPMDDREVIFVEKHKRKGTGHTGLKFLIFLEILGILAVVWWWIKWLY